MRTAILDERGAVVALYDMTDERRAMLEPGSWADFEGKYCAVGAVYDPQTREFVVPGELEAMWAAEEALALEAELADAKALKAEVESKITELEEERFDMVEELTP